MHNDLILVVSWISGHVNYILDYFGIGSPGIEEAQTIKSSTALIVTGCIAISSWQEILHHTLVLVIFEDNSE